VPNPSKHIMVTGLLNRSKWYSTSKQKMKRETVAEVAEVSGKGTTVPLHT